MRFRKTISAIFSLIMAADIISCPMLTAGAEETTTAAAVQQASLSIDFEKTMIKGEKYSLNAKGDGLKYSSDNPDAAVVSSSGVIEAVGSGKAIITVTDVRGEQVSLTVTVNDVSDAGLFGDINRDGIIDGRDATVILTYYARSSTGYKGSLEQFAAEQSDTPVVTSAIATTTKTVSSTNSVASATASAVTSSVTKELSTALATTVTTTVSGDVSDYVSKNESFYCMWMDTKNDKDYVFNGKFIKITAKIKENIPSKDYAIRYRTDFSNINGVSIPNDKVIKGAIRVGGESIEPMVVSDENGFIAYSDNAACKQGDTIDYYINMENNPGLAAALLWFYYDVNAMEILSVEPVGEFAEIIDTNTFKAELNP